MAIGKVEICGVDTSTLPVISNERMRELFPLVHGGDEAAREEFIRGNLRLVLMGLIPAVAGVLLGDRLQKRLDGERFRFFTNCMVMLSGLFLLGNCLLK